MSDEVRARLETVLPGDTLESFAERHHADPRAVIALNEAALRDESAARGFNPTYVRLVPDEHGEHHSEMGHACRREVGWHVHAGQRLLVQDDRDGS